MKKLKYIISALLIAIVVTGCDSSNGSGKSLTCTADSPYGTVEVTFYADSEDGIINQMSMNAELEFGKLGITKELFETEHGKEMLDGISDSFKKEQQIEGAEVDVKITDDTINITSNTTDIENELQIPLNELKDSKEISKAGLTCK